MGLNEHFVQAAVLIGIGWPDDPSRRPVGTGFVVGVPGTAPGQRHLYLVSAAHVVQANAIDQTFVRLRLADGGVRDQTLSGWEFHHEQDVAVVPLALPSDANVGVVEADMFTDDQAGLGDDVYLVGPVRKLPSMQELGIPVVRAGSIARLWQDHIPANLPGQTEGELAGHLIDCRVYQGMSGAPCFVQWPPPQVPGGIAPMHIRMNLTKLLGLVSAHLDDPQEVLAGDDPDLPVRYPMHTGLAVITPARYISEMLALDAFVSQREANP
jgi:hypothetical protein